MADRPAGRHRGATPPRRPLVERVVDGYEWLQARWWLWLLTAALYGWSAYQSADQGWPLLSAAFSLLGAVCGVAAGYLLADRS